MDRMHSFSQLRSMAGNELLAEAEKHRGLAERARSEGTDSGRAREILITDANYHATMALYFSNLALLRTQYSIDLE